MNSTAPYWDRYITARIGRRRLLAGAGTLGLSSATLALLGCGSAGGGTSASSNGLVVRPAETTKLARRGGVFKHFNQVDLPDLDPIVSASSGTIRNRVYQKLFMPKPGYLEPGRTGEIQPDAAESYEITPDGLQVTIKLRPNNHFDQRAPTNGRALTTQDVLFNFRRVESLSGRRTDLFNSANPDASILSYAATDPLTFVIKLAYPDAGLMANLATQNSGFFGGLLPFEADNNGINIHSDPRGSGPWYISKYTPSATIEYTANPGYYDQSFPYIGKIESPIITEYAAQLAQFRAGSLYTMPVNGPDILQTKRDLPELLMYQDAVSVSGTRALWGWKDAGKSPFRDERVRQAFGFAQDRDLFIDTIYNTSDFTQQGLNVPRRWNSTVMGANLDGWWLDPKGKDFGENSRFFSLDLKQAKQLLTAAGYPDGVDAEATFDASGTADTMPMQVIIGMVQQAGFRLKLNPLTNRSEYTTVYTRGRGAFSGLTFGSATAGADPGNQLYTTYNSHGSVFTGFDISGNSSFGGDPTIEDLTTRIRQEFDTQKRWALAAELQKYDAKTQYNPLFPGGAASFVLAWPALSNFMVNQASQTDAVERTWWIDDTKAPIRAG